MAQTFIRKTINGNQYNILDLPHTNIFKFEVVNMYGSNIERVIEKEYGSNIYGLAHLIEHLSFRCTKDYATEDLQELLKNEGVHNASTNYDRINYWFKTTMDRKDLGIKLVCNYAFNDLSKLTDQEFTLEKKVVFNEAKRYADDDQTMFDFNLDPVLCGYHPEDNVIGIPATIDTFTKEIAQDIKQLFLCLGNEVCNITYDSTCENIDTIIENIEKQRARFVLSKNIGKYDVDSIKQKYTQYLGSPKTGEFSVDNESEQAMTGLVIDCVDNIITSRLATAYLAHFAKNTSLTDVIREQNGLTYGIEFEDYRLAYKPYIHFGCDVTRGTEGLLMDLFKHSINDTVDNFDTEKYDKLMKTLQLKRTMSFVNQENYESVYGTALWYPEIIDQFEQDYATDMRTALDKQLDMYCNYDQIRAYMEQIRDKVNKQEYGIVRNDLKEIGK